jgi:hypothetical protein
MQSRWQAGGFLPLLLFVAAACAQQQQAAGFARRVVVVAIDGIAPTLANASTLQRMLAEGAGTVNARANLPSVTVPNWCGETARALTMIVGVSLSDGTG